MFAADRDAGGMNLREGWVRKERPPFVSAIRGCDVASTSVSRQIEHVSISTGREYDGVRCVFFNFSGAQAPRHNSLGMSLDSHEVEHFGLRKHLHRAGFDLAAKRLIAAEQKLL